jgi:subtilisin family serine protease
MSSFGMLRVALVAALCVACIGAAQAQVSPQLAQKAPEAAAIAAAAQQDGFVRVIVEFAGPAPAQLRPDPQVLAPLAADIAARQDAIITSHFGSATNPSPGQGFPRGLTRFEITPMFAVNVSLSELNALADDPAVVRIYYDHRGSPALLQSVPLIGMDLAYLANATGARQAVAVIDTGVQTNHEFLKANIIMDKQACFSNGEATGVTLCPNEQQTQEGRGAADTSTAACVNGDTSLCNHGTHVAGIAAGNNSNPGDGKPANGVARNARIVPIQVFFRTTCGLTAQPCVRYLNSDLMLALQWLYRNALRPSDGVRLAAVNLSLGTDTLYARACDDEFGALKTQIDMLRAVGVVTVVASANDGSTSSISSPACISTAVAVGSTTKRDVISMFSNMSSQVALMAPGGLTTLTPPPPCALGTVNVNILSSYSGTTSAESGDYGCMAGTSMAAPHVAGAFAAIRTVCPDATIDRMLMASQRTGIPIKDTRPAIPFVRPAGTQTKPRISVDLARQALGCASHDFNGDGKSDLVWRDTTGNTSVWLMNGEVPVSQQGIGAPPLTWSLVGQRDFDGDGKSDLLWRDTNGNDAIWFMNGTQARLSAAIAPVPPTWSVVGTGDFSGTGKGGILWRDSAGNTSLWLMDGAQIAANQSLGNIPTIWSITGTGDFDGDGRCDLLWSDTAGNVSIWFMNGTQVQSSVGIGKVDPGVWSVLGIGDFDGDGRSDIVWRDTAGNLSIWFMDGAKIVSQPGFGVVPTTFSLAQTGDYDGDGRSDLLWRDTAGNTSIWFMNGAQAPSMKSVGNIPVTWTLQSLNSN